MNESIIILKEEKQKVLKHKNIKTFIKENNISEEYFNDDFAIYLSQYTNSEICKQCQGINHCQMDLVGQTTRLISNKGRASLEYHPCRYYNSGINNEIDFLFFPHDSYLLYKEVDINNLNRANIFKEITRFTSNYKKEDYTKGIYLYGEFGTGKTFLLLHLAQTLAKRNISCLFAYYPDLVRSIKSAIGNNSVEQYVDKLKTVEVLILDDIGGENNSAFIRDEILGPVLQYRLLSNLPVFMTSNLSLDLLKNHFKETAADIDDIKSSRMIERIRAMMEIVELKGKKYR